MKQYYKEVNGERIWFKNILIVGDSQIINPTEEQILEAGYVEYVYKKPELTEEQKLTMALNDAVQKINDWDNSRAVNNCVIIYQEQELPYWANKAERNDLKAAIKDYINAGRENYRLDLRDLGIAVTIPCEALLNMLSALEVYAIECYNKTTDHIFAVNALTTIEEIEAYDYTIGYPKNLTFNL